MLKRKILMSLSGVVICAVSVGIFKLAAFGVDPFQAFMSGMDKLIPIEFGTLYVIVNVVLLLFSLIFDRRKIGIATFINLFLLGYITQFTYEGLQTLFPSPYNRHNVTPPRKFPSPSMPLRIGCLIIAIIIICFGTALYMTADLGVSTYDAVAIVMSEKWKLGKFKYIRVITDIVCVVSGIVIFLLGKGKFSEVSAFVGVGTIITAFFMGPLIELFNEKVARKILAK